MRCSKCWQCPACASALAMRVAGAPPAEQRYHLACGYCHWSSRGQQEASQPEQLVAQIIAQEREDESRQHMAVLVEAFRARAQEQLRDRELAQRVRRRAALARGSFASGALGSTTARRLSSGPLLRNPRLAAHGAAAAQAGAPQAWALDDLEVQLRQPAPLSLDLHAAARAAASADASPAASPLASPKASAAASAAPTSSPRAAAAEASSAAAARVPVLEGLTVEELLRAHTEAGPDGGPSLLEATQQSLRDDEEGAAGAASSLAQRLRQASCGCRRLGGRVGAPAPGALRVGGLQPEAPLQRRDALQPVRFPLLTRRSRRCRLLRVGGEGPAPCRGVVVKPHVNPCSSPPFQKNGAAVAFVPRCAPWAWVRAGGSSGSLAEAAPAPIMFINIFDVIIFSYTLCLLLYPIYYITL